MTIKEVSEKYDISQDTLRYYERIGMIPPVTRTSSGIRDYQESDLGWVEHVICIIEYVKLCQEGDETIPARLQLLVEQRKNLLDQMGQMNVTLKRLNYKIDRYETAVKTGELSWD